MASGRATRRGHVEVGLAGVAATSEIAANSAEPTPRRRASGRTSDLAPVPVEVRLEHEDPAGRRATRRRSVELGEEPRSARVGRVRPDHVVDRVGASGVTASMIAANVG